MLSGAGTEKLLVPRWPPRPLAAWKNTGSRRQRCPGPAACAPTPARPQRAQSALLSPCQRFASPRGEGARGSERAWVGASSPRLLVPSFPCAQAGGQLFPVSPTALCIPKSPTPICISSGTCTGHGRGNSLVWLAGARFLPDLCCQSPWKLVCSGVIIAGGFWWKQQKLVGSRPGLLITVSPCQEQPAALQTHSRAKRIRICTRQPPLDTSSIPPFITSLGQSFVS